MNDFLTFRRMITPLIIEILFWVGAVVIAITGLAVLVSGISSTYGGDAEVLMGLVILVIGPIGVRIYCELLIVFFRMNETLTDIKNTLEHRVPGNLANKVPS